MANKRFFGKKILGDAFASLIASNILGNFIAYYAGNYEVKSSTYWITFFILITLFIVGLIFLRKQKTQKKNIWDFIFPVFLVSFALLLIGAAVSLGDIYDKDFGKKVLDSIDNDFTRNLLDIYASSANQALIVKPLGLFLVLFCTILSRFLGAFSAFRR